MRNELESGVDGGADAPGRRVPGLIGSLEEIKATALVRLTAPVIQPQAPDSLLSIDEAAPVLGMSKLSVPARRQVPVHSPPRAAACASLAWDSGIS